MLADSVRRCWVKSWENCAAFHLITDYKTLYTKNNPFRFRTHILDRVRQIEGDALLMPRLAAGYVSEGRAATEREAEEVIR